MWTACAAWENVEPVVGQAKAHEETLLFPDGSTHFFEGNEDTLHDPSDSPLYLSASPYREQLIEDFCVGVIKFAKLFSLARLGDVAEAAACSRSTLRRRHAPEGTKSRMWLTIG
jgi:hypothetical protein